MPVTISLQHHPVGYVVGFGEAEGTVVVQPKEFSSSEDGNDFITRLDGVSACYREAFTKTGVACSQVDNFLAVVTPGKEATVYLNELRLVTRARVKRVVSAPIEVGGSVFFDDIADVDELEIQDAGGRPVVVPADCGFSLILSFGWRKGLYFDYSVFGPHGRPRTDSLNRLFGHFLARLMFQEMYSISEAQWHRLLGWGWFPFIGLADEDRKKLLSWARQDRDPRPALEEIAQRFVGDLEARVQSWCRFDYLRQRVEFLTRARERLEAGDYLSCINLLYPQIEGVMRALFVEENGTDSPGQSTMVTNLVENQFAHSVLLPNRFEEYLRTVYFRNFDERGGDLPLSRHTVAHGIARPDDYTFQRAVLGFLVLDQLFHYLSD